MSGCLIFQGNRLGVNPILTCDPRGFGVFGGRNTAPTFAEVEFHLRPSGSHFLGRGGKFDPRPTFAAVGFHLRPTAAVKVPLGPRPTRRDRRIGAATHPAVARTGRVGRGSNPLGRVSKTLVLKQLKTLTLDQLDDSKLYGLLMCWFM